MGDEAQRIIREARARAMDRLAAAGCPCPGSGGGGGGGSGSGGGAIRRHPPPTSSGRPQYEPPAQPFFSLSPDRRPNPETMAHLQQVFDRSLNPVPQPREIPEEEYQPPVWDYPLQDPGPYEQNPALWEEVQGYDPFGQQGAECLEPERRTSYYEILSECTQPEVDYVTGAPEEVLGRARHRGLLAGGFRKDIPLCAPPLQPGEGMAIFEEKKKDPPVIEGSENEGPSLDEILAGAPELPPPASDTDVYEQGFPETEDEDEDLNLLPPTAIEDLEEDFAVQTAKKITTDAFGLPFRQYPHAEKARQEKMRREQAQREWAQRLQVREAALNERKAYEQAKYMVPDARAAAPVATRAGGLCRPASARAPPSTSTLGQRATRTTSTAPGPSTSRGAGPASLQRPSTSRGPHPPTTPRRLAAPASSQQPSTSRGAFPASSQRPSTSRGACPPGTQRATTTAGGAAPAATASKPDWQAPGEENKAEKAAKAAALLELHKKRTQYQPPKLKSRPPTKPPTKPKAPRCLEKRDRDTPDPTRNMMYDPVYGYVEQEPMWDFPQPRAYPDVPEPLSYCPQPQRGPGAVDPGDVPQDLLNDITGIIQQTRNSLVNTIHRYSQ